MVDQKKMASGARAAAVAIVIGHISCGAPRDTKGIGVGDENQRGTAYAAPGTGGAAGAKAVVFENLSRVVIRILKADHEHLDQVANIRLTKFSGQAFPEGSYEVLRDEEGMVIVTFVPQGELVQMALRAFDEEGMTIGGPTKVRVISHVKQYTEVIQLWGGEQKIEAPSELDKELTEGETLFEGPIRDEFLDTDRRVLRGLFRAPAKGTYRIQCLGTERLHYLTNGVLTCAEGPVEVSLCKDQEVAFFPELVPPDESVATSIESVPPEE